jgi:hypothetical protein
MKNIGITILVWAMSIVLAFFLFRQCGTPRIIEKPTIVFKRDTVRDTISYSIIKYVPKISYTDTGSIQWKYLEIDSLAILKAYFAKNFYRDTILSDSNAFIVLDDTIYQNQIISRYVKAEVYPLTIYEKTTITQPAELHNKLFLGFGAGGNMDKFGLSADFMFQNKRDNTFAGSYDFINKEIWVRTFFKIKF